MVYTFLFHNHIDLIILEFCFRRPGVGSLVCFSAANLRHLYDLTKKKGKKDYTHFTRWYVNKNLQNTKAQTIIVSKMNFLFLG